MVYEYEVEYDHQEQTSNKDWAFQLYATHRFHQHDRPIEVKGTDGEWGDVLDELSGRLPISAEGWDDLLNERYEFRIARPFMPDDYVRIISEIGDEDCWVIREVGDDGQVGLYRVVDAFRRRTEHVTNIVHLKGEKAKQLHEASAERKRGNDRSMLELEIVELKERIRELEEKLAEHDT